MNNKLIDFFKTEPPIYQKSSKAFIKAVFQSDIQTVWDIVTSLENYWWRSDLCVHRKRRSD